MRLAYKATTPNGKILQGVIEAKTLQEAAAYLRSKELLPIRIAEKKDTSILSYIPFLNKARSDLVMFTRQLASMITSGLTLMQGLRILENQVSNERMKEVIRNIITDVEDGASFADAIEKYPEVFSQVYVALIRAAESSGLMDKILAKLADNLEKEQQLRSTVKGALMYPIIVVIGMITVMAIMMIFVIPQLAGLYQGLNVDLPLPTRIVIGISDFMKVFWPVILALIALGIFLFRRWHKTPAGKLLTDSFVLKLPIFGPLIKDSSVAEITRIFGLLTGAGILVVEAIHETANVVNNVMFKNAMLNVSENVEKGVSIGESMEINPLFPPIVIEMVKVGEQTGKLDDSLLRLSTYYEAEVDMRIKAFTTLLEPILISVLGIGVGFLLFAVISPIYSILNNI